MVARRADEGHVRAATNRVRVMIDQTDVMKDLVAKVDKANVWGSTPLINAAHNAHAHVVHHLILNGGNCYVDVRITEDTAALVPLANGKADLLEALAGQGLRGGDGG